MSNLKLTKFSMYIVTLHNMTLPSVYMQQPEAKEESKEGMMEDTSTTDRLSYCYVCKTSPAARSFVTNLVLIQEFVCACGKLAVEYVVE